MVQNEEMGARLQNQSILRVWETPNLSRLEAEEAEATRAGVAADAIYS